MICLLLNLGSWNCPVQANSCFYRRSRSELQWLLAVLLKLSTALAGETELVHTKGRDGSLVPNTLLSSRRENQTSLLFKDMGCSQLRVFPKLSLLVLVLVAERGEALVKPRSAGEGPNHLWGSAGASKAPGHQGCGSSSAKAAWAPPSAHCRGSWAGEGANLP